MFLFQIIAPRICLHYDITFSSLFVTIFAKLQSCKIDLRFLSDWCEFLLILLILVVLLLILVLVVLVRLLGLVFLTLAVKCVLYGIFERVEGPFVDHLGSDIGQHHAHLRVVVGSTRHFCVEKVRRVCVLHSLECCSVRASSLEFLLDPRYILEVRCKLYASIR